MKLSDFKKYLKGQLDVYAQMVNDKAYSAHSRELAHHKYEIMVNLNALAQDLVADPPEPPGKVG